MCVLSAPYFNCFETSNSLVYQFDVAINQKPHGRIVFKLYDSEVPRTAKNFRELATGQHGFGYAGSKFHRIIPNVRHPPTASSD